MATVYNNLERNRFHPFPLLGSFQSLSRKTRLMQSGHNMLWSLRCPYVTTVVTQLMGDHSRLLVGQRSTLGLVLDQWKSHNAAMQDTMFFHKVAPEQGTETYCFSPTGRIGFTWFYTMDHHGSSSFPPHSVWKVRILGSERVYRFHLKCDLKSQFFTHLRFPSEPTEQGLVVDSCWYLVDVLAR